MKKLNGVNYDATMELVSKAFGGISFDNESWELKEIPDGIRLVQKKHLDVYDFTCGVFALQQVSPYNFIIHCSPEPWYYCFLMVKLKNGKMSFMESLTYTTADFLSPQLVLFNKHHLYATAVPTNIEVNPLCLSSLSVESSISVASQFHPTIPDKDLCDSRKIKLICKGDSKYPTYLMVEYKLSSTILQEYVQILLNPTTLLPMSPAYSTIRGKYFDFTESFTLYDLIAEDRNYFRTATDFLLQIYSADGRKTDEELIATIDDH